MFPHIGLILQTAFSGTRNDIRPDKGRDNLSAIRGCLR